MDFGTSLVHSCRDPDLQTLEYSSIIDFEDGLWVYEIDSVLVRVGRAVTLS
jgi:hypothetical protein